MKQFFLTAAGAIAVTTSLVSNLLSVTALRPMTAVGRSRLQSALGGFRGLVDMSVAAAIARSERQAASSDASLDNGSRFHEAHEAGGRRR